MVNSRAVFRRHILSLIASIQGTEALLPLIRQKIPVIGYHWTAFLSVWHHAPKLKKGKGV
jgi:hypothetical protein